MKSTTYTYKPRPFISPLKEMRDRVYDVRNIKHPIREEITKCIGTLEFKAIIEEDSQSLAVFKNIPGVIAFLCTLKKGDEVISQGRGSSILNDNNRYLTRSVRYALNASLIDAVVRSTKALDTLYLSKVSNDVIPQKEASTESLSEDNHDLATDKQKSYLLGLISTKVSDEEERYVWEERVGSLTKDEASEAIQSLSK